MHVEDQLEVKLAGAEVRAVGEDGVIEGYASVFGNADSGGDVVAPGAFKNSLAARPADQVRMLWQHDANEPIGVWEHIAEDARGLLVRGRLLGDVARGREVLSLLRAGAIDGLSIGFRTVRARMDERTGVRTLLEIDLWEISIVTFPMNDAARVAGVKQADSLRDLESFPQDSDQDLRELAFAIRQAARAMSADI
ncbi:MAG: HK97 family phage prohead protease [Alphaproteobacteria bacterium]